MSSKLYLQPVKVTDAKILAQWFNDHENVKYMSPYVRCLKHTPKSVALDIKNTDPDLERQFMVYIKNKKEPIGYAGIEEIDFDDKRGEIYFLIGDRSEQGKGYGQEITRLLIDYAFNKLKLHSLFADVTVLNKPSIKLMEKCGFRRIGVRRDYNYIDGKFVDEVFFDLVKKE